MKNDFLQEMQDRGFLNQCTDLDKLGEICNKKSISGYIGFDCTASSLHVGSLLQIMILRLMQKHGHRPIVLLGGGTTLIGDPSGKDTTRKILGKKDPRNMISEYLNVIKIIQPDGFIIENVESILHPKNIIVVKEIEEFIYKNNCRYISHSANFH